MKGSTGQPGEDREDDLDKAFAAYLRLVDTGDVPDLDRFLESQPSLSAELRALIETADAIQAMASGDRPVPATDNDTPHGGTRTVAFDMSSHLSASNQPPEEPLSPSGEREFGEYVLLEELGRGGMGVVYKARQKSMNRLVALKMIISGGYSSERSIHRFYQEAKAAGKLGHRNIVRAYAVGEHEGQHFFAMELIEGRTLRDILKTQDDKLPSMTVARHMLALAEAVQYAHDQGILHRDLKPSNVMVDNKDVLKITDFGLAKHLDPDEERSFESSSGSVIGTPSYMSPEQAASRREQVGPASDVYSLGAILYELLTGRPPFQDSSPVGTLLLVLNQDVTPPSDVQPGCHRDLEAICLKCLEKHPDDRYRSCKDLAADLNRVLRGEPVKARRLTQSQRLWFWLRGFPLVAYATGRNPRNATKLQRRAQWATMLAVGLCLGMFMAWPTITEYAHLRTVQIGVGEMAGEYDRIGSMLGRTFPPGRTEIVNTRGSLDSRDQLLRYDVDVCILQDNTVSFEDIAIVAPLYREAILIVVRNTSGIYEARDMTARAIALGAPTSGVRATSEQILGDLGISTIAEFRDYAWTALATNDGLEGAIVTVSLRDSRLKNLLSSGEFQIVPLPAADLPERFRPHQFMAHELPADAGVGPEGISSATAEAVLAVRKNAPSSFVRQCLEGIYHTDDELRGSVLALDQAAAWSEGRSLHSAARRFFKSQSTLQSETAPAG